MKQKKMISEEKQDPVCERLLLQLKNEDRSSVCNYMWMWTSSCHMRPSSMRRQKHNSSPLLCVLTKCSVSPQRLDVEFCLDGHSKVLKHMGIRGQVRRRATKKATR